MRPALGRLHRGRRRRARPGRNGRSAERERHCRPDLPGPGRRGELIARRRADHDRLDHRAVGRVRRRLPGSEREAPAPVRGGRGPDRRPHARAGGLLLEVDGAAGGAGRVGHDRSRGGLRPSERDRRRRERERDGRRRAGHGGRHDRRHEQRHQAEHHRDPSGHEAGNATGFVRFGLGGRPDFPGYRLPRSACSRSMATNSSLKFPSPNPREP